MYYKTPGDTRVGVEALAISVAHQQLKASIPAFNINVFGLVRWLFQQPSGDFAQLYS